MPAALAQIIRTGWYRAVHVKSTPSRSARALLGARRTMLNKQRDIENAVRAVLREVGLKLGTPSRKLFSGRVRELASADAAISDIVEPLLAVLDAMARQIERLTKHVLNAVKVEPICRRLMTVPGVGPLTALAFRATVDRPERFRLSRDVGAISVSRLGGINPAKPTFRDGSADAATNSLVPRSTKRRTRC